MNGLALAAYLVNAAHEQLSHAQRQLYRELEQRQGQKPRQVAECGTPSGYQRHRREDGVPCYACMTAHTWYESHRRRRAS